jgi:hypothetical protein
MSWCKTKYNSLKEYFSSQDTQQNITVAISFISDAFKVVMASLLCLFVPQQCNTIENNSDIFNTAFSNNIIVESSISIPSIANTLNGTSDVLHMCSFTENFANLIDYNTFVLTINFITLGYFIYLYYIELRREVWLINNFDYDKEKTDENILTLKDTYPEVIDVLQKHNYKYMLTYKYLFILYIVNFISSAVLVLYFYYYDYRTITTLITNVVLCSNKIRIGRNISRKSYEKEYAYSYYNSKNLSFNVIDHRYLKNDKSNRNDKNDKNDLINDIDKKGDNIHKHLYSIKKYINTL